MEVKSIETTTENWVRGSIVKAYLRSEKDLNWLMGIIRDANLDKGKLRNILNEVNSYYPNNIRVKELEKNCEEKGFL
jgi:hypothetical protein